MLTDSGVEHRYDALVLAVGGRIRARYEHAITLETSGSSELLRGLIKDVESGYVRRLIMMSHNVTKLHRHQTATLRA